MTKENLHRANEIQEVISSIKEKITDISVKTQENIY